MCQKIIDSIVGTGIASAKRSGKTLDAIDNRMLLRITKLPRKGRIEGFDLRAYEPGVTYDLRSGLAELLVVLGCARVEMRRGPRRATDESGGSYAERNH